MPAKLMNRIRLAEAYLLKNPMPRGMPSDITLELTNRCDLHCPMCPRDLCKRPIGDMDLELLKDVLDQAVPGLEMSDLCLDGEPLLYPELEAALRILEDRGVKTYLQTTALLLDRDKAEMLLDSGLDAIVFSLDADTRETYEKVHGAGNIEIARNNISRFLEMRSNKGSSLSVTVQLVAQKMNSHEISAFKKRWANSTVDAVRIKPLNINYHNRPREGQLVPASNVFDKSAALRCIRLWRSMTVLWDGTCVPCCYDFCGIAPIGDLKIQPLNDVWLGEKLVELRTLHSSGRLEEIPLCREWQ
ncbi:MAG: radical SAM protein [Deltaproteobacteria bacterium]|nr:radical SAM protein [Deltaproteobacteria bacterium]